jgi:hypothetical protein
LDPYTNATISSPTVAVSSRRRTESAEVGCAYVVGPDVLEVYIPTIDLKIVYTERMLQDA